MNKKSIQNKREEKLNLLYSFLKDKDFEISSHPIVEISKKIKWRCKIDGHEWYAPIYSIMDAKGNAKSGCPECGRKRTTESNVKYSEVDIQNLIKENLKDYIVYEKYERVSNGYIKLYLYCLRHNIKWNPYLHNIIKSGLSCGCPECGKENTSGINNYNWNGGITDLRLYLRNFIKTWRKKTIKHYNGKCAVTGKPFEEIHHIHSFDMILKETFNVLNICLKENIGEYSDDELKLIKKEFKKIHDKYGIGICLTKEVHKKFHDLYGFGENNQTQFDNFIKNHINE